MTTVNQDGFGRWALGGLAVGIVGALLVVLLLIGPEPCTDGTGSTACAATTHREEP